MKNKKQNVRVVDQFRGYYLEDCACQYCAHYNKKRGCELTACCCENEKRDALAHGRIQRERALRWDM